jgi:hypothetical protein
MATQARRGPKKGKHPAPAKPERIKIISRMMASQQWVTGVTYLELAAKWKLGPAVLRLDAAEASRLVHRAVSEDVELRSRVVQQLEHLGAEARRKKDTRHALEALRILVGVTDPKDPIKVQVQIEKGLEELLEKARAILPAEHYDRLLAELAGQSGAAAAVAAVGSLQHCGDATPGTGPEAESSPGEPEAPPALCGDPGEGTG